MPGYGQLMQATEFSLSVFFVGGFMIGFVAREIFNAVVKWSVWNHVLGK